MAKHNMISNLKEAQLDSGGKVFGWGPTVPTDEDIGYATGCLFFDTDASAGAIVHINEGTYASCAFKALPSDADLDTLTDGSNADALHVHAAAGLVAALQDLIPTISFSGTDDTDGTGTMDIQVKDAAGNNLSQRFKVRTWIADADFSEADPKTDYSVTVGEELDEIEANADYSVISTAAGLITMNINQGSAGTVYVMASIDGRIYSQSLAITGP